MPINLKEYHPKWTLISRLIRIFRAKNKCERCGAPNGELVQRNGSKWRIATDEDLAFIESVKTARGCSYAAALKSLGYYKIILTTAHLDHDRENNRFDNLAALCQRCHLGHDRSINADKRKYGLLWKKHQGTLQFENNG